MLLPAGPGIGDSTRFVVFLFDPISRESFSDMGGYLMNALAWLGAFWNIETMVNQRQLVIWLPLALCWSGWFDVEVDLRSVFLGERRLHLYLS